MEKKKKKRNSPSHCDGEPVGPTSEGSCQLRYCDWVILGKITTLKVMLNNCEGEFRASGPGKGRKELLSPVLVWCRYNWAYAHVLL